MKIKKKIVKNINGLNYFILEAGDFKLKKSNAILFLHGFPELSYSYRHLIKLFSKIGYYCIAPDQRGYGRTSLIDNIKDFKKNYSIINLTKDIYLLLKSLKISKVNLVGHDFGSYVACFFGLIYPKLSSSIVIMSMPFSGTQLRKNKGFNIKKINKNLNALRPAKKHYQLYLSGKSANNNIMNCSQGISKFLRSYYYFKSYDFDGNKPHKLKNYSTKELKKMPEYYIMKNNLGISQTVSKYMPSKAYVKECAWLTEKDLNIFSNSFKNTSFKGPLSWYGMMLDEKEKQQILDLNLSRKIFIPALFVAGEADWGIFQKPGDLIKMEKEFFNNYYGTKIIKKAGHWVQQEKPKETFKVINSFYKKIRKSED